MKRESQYNRFASNQVIALHRADRLKDYLHRTVGGVWESRVWPWRYKEHKVWCYICTCGSIRVDEDAAEYCNGGWSVSNIHLNGRNIIVYKRKNIAWAVKRLLGMQMRKVNSEIAAYQNNYKLRSYKILPIAK